MLVPQLMAQPTDSLNLRMGADKGQLLSDKGDVDLHIIVFRIALITPDLEGQCLPADNLPLIAEQIFQNTGFLVAETNLMPGSSTKQRCVFFVQRQISECQCAVLGNPVSPAQCSKPCQQLRHLKGFREIVVRSAVQPSHLI
jgi:hypothetical protein